MKNKETIPSSAWSPLRQPVFRALWIVTIFSNIGTWVHDVGAGWLMTSLSPSPLMVSLVQTAGTLPMFPGSNCRHTADVYSGITGRGAFRYR
jgi:hypothetical protein